MGNWGAIAGQIAQGYNSWNESVLSNEVASHSLGPRKTDGGKLHGIVLNATAVILRGHQSGPKISQTVTLFPYRQLAVSPTYHGSTYFGVGSVGVQIPGFVSTTQSVKGSFPNFTVNMRGSGIAAPLAAFFGSLFVITYDLNTSVSFTSPSVTVSGSVSAYPSTFVTVDNKLVYGHFEEYGLAGLLPGVSVSPPGGP